jgi:hypothetical protein
MGDDPRKETPTPAGRQTLPILWPTLGILLLYILAPPFTERIFGTQSPVLNTAYAPLGFLITHVPIVHHFYEWYYDLVYALL